MKTIILKPANVEKTYNMKTKLYKFFCWFFSSRFDLLMWDIMVLLILVWTIKHFGF